MAGLRQFVLGDLPAAVLAGVFGLAAVFKLVDPVAFADQITGFELLPHGLVAPAAILLPGVELTAALALLWRRSRRPASALIAALLLIFIIAALTVIARGLDVPCGCFGNSDRVVGWGLVLQDLGLLLIAGWLLRREGIVSTSIEGKPCVGS